MPTLTIEPLEPDERVRLRGTKGGGLFLLALAFAFPAIPVGCAFLTHPMQYPLMTLGGIVLIIATACLILYLIYLWSEHKVSLDLKANRKLVLDTTIARLDERYFRGISSYYLNVADDGPDVPRRRFQIDKAVYDQLRNGERIRIAFVPISGRVLEIASAAGRHLI
ncbi:hypothetical protein BLA18112_05905 [Burkholderia lata]|uniref:DUF3592 domain-containing protein n=1 Tax=Burkholderia lata (strain ATCC 17760 / DSM 23089 / LMG 22485 / NCIMB 9086 / R18194 / 383) TaxID=482957 RepID=A0A6P2Z2I6_BURL3|nr:hypothetical protein [Burkholderia lata]VWD28800.1 hypothetical protein BLA18112_05905 [Burkholderia lata]